MIKKTRILAIDPGTREMGVAVLEHGSLVYHGVETFRKLSSPQGRRHGITVVSFAPNTVKKAVAGYGWAPKAEVAKAIAARYPKLKAYLPPGRKWKLQRHYNMFDAVALGVACLSVTRTRRRHYSHCQIRAP